MINKNDLRCVLVEGNEGRITDDDFLLSAGHHDDDDDEVSEEGDVITYHCIAISQTIPLSLSPSPADTQCMTSLLRIYK